MEQTIPNQGKSPKKPLVRKLDFDFTDLPRKWFADSVFPTHIVNGLNLVFPEGERFFIRSVKHYLDQVKDPELLERVKGFFGQEARHGREHEIAFEVLEKQGYVIRPFLEMYDRIAFKGIEARMPPSIRLSVTVALEHFTAALAEEALGTELLDHAHPAMRDLLRWHASEEIEHKSVAFDVFQAVDGRYWMRMTGLGMGALLLVGFWTMGTRMLMKQEHLTPEETRKERRAAAKLKRNGNALRKAFFQYIRPGFHPDQIDNQHLANAYLEGIGRLSG